MTSEAVTYHGVPGTGLIEIIGQGPAKLLPLTGRAARHSPTGFGWGYSGSGPAATAWALLAHALGPLAACPSCAGTRKIVQLYADRDPEPWRPGSYAEDVVQPCPDCDDGHRRLPYQDFKFAVVAAWPQDGEWRISRSDILWWLNGYLAANRNWDLTLKAVTP